MSQNRSHAVMQQRAEPNDSLDDFPTPPWGTRALCNWIEGNIGCLDAQTVWEPAANRGYMARPLGEFFQQVMVSDVHSYTETVFLHDFLQPYLPPFMDGGADWIISNPPFRLGKEFALKASTIARTGVALLARTAFLEGAERYRELFLPHPPAAVLQFVERLPMVKGRYDPKASSATAYCWIIWLPHAAPAPPTTFHWIPPCRTRLERAQDYPSITPQS